MYSFTEEEKALLLPQYVQRCVGESGEVKFN